MKYSIRELAKMAGVTTRTLRYYDEIGLLKPAYVEDSGYRFYSRYEVDLLQQIMFYRERGLGLEQISNILYTEGFDIRNALESHLTALGEQKLRVNRLIDTVKKTIASMEGEIIMKDKEKFEAFKQRLVEENESKYGEETCLKYGSDAVDDANSRLMQMDEKEFGHFQKLEKDLLEKLQASVLNQENPAGEAGKEIALLHRDWLCCTGITYSEELHRGIAEIYVSDPRFTEYYDGNVEGCAEFLRQAVKKWI